MIDLSDIPLQPKTAGEALRALETVSARFRALGDPRAAFPDIYAVITRRVAEEVQRSPSAFLEPAWVSRLAGRFCERYLETLCASLEGAAQGCAAWDLAYRYGALGATLPCQEVVLGLSAHINYDLALGIHENILEFGHAGDARMLARYKHDHDKVNELLEECIPEAFARLVVRHGCVTSAAIRRHARRPAAWATMQVLQRWRAQVWDVVRGLLAADTEVERAAFVAEMERRAGQVAAALTLASSAWVAGRALLRPAPLVERYAAAA